jgi:hypothetical protein
MRRLSRDGFKRAREFMRVQARPLDRARFGHAFEGGAIEPVLRELDRYRNEDGGFGHALEPDLRLPGSSVIATTIALQILRELGVPGGHARVKGTIDYLLRTYDPDLGGWRCVPPEVDSFPRANHWNWAVHGEGSRWPIGVNPRAEILAHFYHYPDRVPAGLLEELTGNTLGELDRVSVEIGADSLLCCVWLVGTTEAPQPVRDRVMRRVREIGLEMVNRDPEQWGGYVPKPLKLAPLPSSPLAPDLAEEIAGNLDYEIEHQQPDGSWLPYWSWGEAFPEVWEEAKREWQGELTLRTLATLAAYDRIES